MSSRPLVLSVDRIHQIQRRREETRLARYDLLLGSVSRLISRAVLLDPRRSNIFISLHMLMSRELCSPGIDIATGIQYICTVLRRNGYTCDHVGEGILLISWPPARTTFRDDDMTDAERAANTMLSQTEVRATPEPVAVVSVSPEQVQGARDTLSNIKRVVARYK